MASILLIRDGSRSHELIRSALGLLGHDVVVAERHRVQGRYHLALAEAGHLERAREVSKRAAQYPTTTSPRLICDEVSRLLAS